jgi:hypothetical protein
MRIAKRALLVIMMTAVPLAALAGPAKSADRVVTVGEFAIMLASARGEAPSLEASKAVQLMVQAGVPLPADPSQPLTERALADVLDFYGVKVTGTADRAVSQGKATAALLSVAGAAGAAAPGPASLDDCLNRPNHGQCVVCCKEMGGRANTCAKFCFAINKPSPSEPLP